MLTVDALALAGVQIFGNRADAAVSLWTVNAAALTAWVNVLIVQHGWINYPLGVLWSLSVEMAFYLLFPLACLALRRGWALAALAAGLIVAGPLYRLASQGEAGAYLYGYAACFDAIAMGCCAAVLARRGRFAVLDVRPCARSSARPWRGCTWPGPSARAMCWARPRWRSARPCCCWAGPRRQGRMPGPRALAACGRLSYEIYLFHLVVLGLIRGWAPPALASGDARVALLAVYLAASCAAGWLVARWWSEPANAALRLHTRA